jgi:hypothetical protein
MVRTPGKEDALPAVFKYPLPPVLTGVCNAPKYRKWLRCKADQLQKRDKKLNRPHAKNHSQADYKMKIHEAVMRNDGLDPYTGAPLRWDLIGRWDENKEASFKERRNFPGAARYRTIKKEFYLLPVIDHVDPGARDLDFEIVSWIVNEGKSQMTPREYIDLCAKVAEHGRKNGG